MVDILVIGGGGHAKVLISILKKLTSYNIIGYLDIKCKESILEIPCLGNDSCLINYFKEKNVSNAVFGIGTGLKNNLKVDIIKKAKEIGYYFPPIISPNAIINEDVVLGEGTVVMDGVIINSGTKVGSYSVLNTRSSIDHDCIIGDFVHLAPGVTLSGGIAVGDNTLLGVGSVCLPNINIIKNCIIGAGSVIISDVNKSGVYVGVPAQKIK